MNYLIYYITVILIYIPRTVVDIPHHNGQEYRRTIRTGYSTDVYFPYSSSSFLH